MKRMILVAFLLSLYIVPSIFVLSSSSVSIVEQPNNDKEFSLSLLSGWSFRREVYLNGSADASTNYTVRIDVPYESAMQSDYDDIRFTDNDESTLLDHWRETYNATYALFWVKVTDSLASDTSIYMYFGNDDASDASDGLNTFLMFEDWDSQSVRASVWDVVTSDGSVSYSAVGASHGTIAKFDANAGATYRITSDYSQTASFAVRFFSNIEESTAGNTARQGAGYDGAFSFGIVQTTATGELFYVYDDDANQDSQALGTTYFDSWTTWEIQRGWEGIMENKTRLYANGTLLATQSCDPDENENPCTSIMLTDSEDDIYSDWVLVRTFISDEPELFGFGDVEPPADWQEVDAVTLIFYVLPNVWGLNMLYLLLGLVLVPTSTMYIVWSAKTKNDKTSALYFGLILMVIGWGLIFQVAFT